MIKRNFLSLVSMVFIAAMTLTSCEEMMSAIDNPVGSYVQFPSTELTLQIGEDRPFQATTISPAKITYKSSDESVVTIDPQGFVTGIAFGEATITASVPATEYYAAGEATCKVKVGSVLQKALKEGAILSFDLNVDGVDESVSFKKVGDEFVYQAPMASAPRRTAAIITSYSLVYYPAKYELEFKVKQTDGTNTAYPLTVIFNLSKNTIQVIPGSPLSNVLFINVKLNGVIITGMLTKKEVAPTSVVIKGAPTTPFEMNVGGGDVTLTADVLPNDATDKSVTWSSSNTAVATVDKTGKVHAVAVGTTTIKVVTANGKEDNIALTVSEAPVIVDLSKLTANYTAQNGETLTGTLDVASHPVKVSIADGATVTLDNVTINGVHNNSYSWAGITCEGNATIVLKDGTTNTVKGFHATYPGVFVPSGKTLIIKGETLGTGKLIASSNSSGDDGAAGIGGGYEHPCGNIEIQGGDITATGSNCSAGIGGCAEGTCGNITISGGKITAQGAYGAAGIGSGEYQGCGNITITGGTIEATGGGQGAGIGSGQANAYCGTITITDGVTKVTATKGGGAPNSIGAGNGGSCGKVTIGGVEGAISDSPYTYQPVH